MAVTCHRRMSIRSCPKGEVVSIDKLAHIFDTAPQTPEAAWNYGEVTKLASLQLPDTVFGDDESLLKGDQHRLWLRWFLEGLASPHILAGDPNNGRLEVFNVVFRRITQLYSTIDHFRRYSLANKLTDLLFADVQRIRRSTHRDYASKATRTALISASPAPRCYLCGYVFSQEACDAFRQVKGSNPVRLPALVDILRPRGLKDREIKIEIEHIVPVASGGSGQTNLRLACGWCNIYKSSKVSLYEAAFMPARTSAFFVGTHRLHELPQRFWTVRLLALKGKCQHQAGCSATAADAELFIALRDWSGSPNPTNLAVYCERHDPVAADRMLPAATVDALWGH